MRRGGVEGPTPPATLWAADGEGSVCARTRLSMDSHTHTRHARAHVRTHAHRPRTVSAAIVCYDPRGEIQTSCRVVRMHWTRTGSVPGWGALLSTYIWYGSRNSNSCADVTWSPGAGRDAQGPAPPPGLGFVRRERTCARAVRSAAAADRGRATAGAPICALERRECRVCVKCQMRDVCAYARSSFEVISRPVRYRDRCPLATGTPPPRR